MSGANRAGGLCVRTAERLRARRTSGARLAVAVATATVAAGLAGPAFGANDAWSTSPVDGTFSNVNWTVNATVGGPNTGTVASGDALFFDASPITTLTNDTAGFTFAGLTFNADAAAYNIGGNALTLAGGINNLGATAQLINAPISLAGTQGVNAVGNVSLTGPISGAGFGLTKLGAGQLTLSSNASSYTGVTAVQAGTLQLTVPGSAGTGAINLSGGTLSVASATPITNAVNVLSTSSYTQTGDLGLPAFTAVPTATLNLALTDSAGHYNTETSPLTGFLGTFNLGASTGTFRFNNTANLGAPFATFNLGSGSATLNSAVNNTSTIPIGALAGGPNTTLAGSTSARSVTYAVGGNNATTEFDGLVTDGVGPSVVSLNKTGAGTMTLTHAETYTGSTAVSNGGTLAVIFPAATTANPLPNTALTLNGGALTLTGAAGAADTQSFTTLTVNSGPGRLFAVPGAGGTTAVTVAGAVTRTTSANNANVGGTLRVGTTGSVTFAANLSQGILTDAAGNPFAAYGADDWAATNAAGQVVAATYAPVTSGAITNGVIDDVQGNATASGAAPLAIRFSNNSSTGTVTLTNSGTSTLRGILVTSGSPGAVIGGATSFIRPNRVSVAGATFTVFQDSTVGDLTILASITNASSSTPVALAKTGNGRVILGTGNSYTGQTFVNDGIVSVNGNFDLGAEATGAPVNLFNGDLEATASFALENSAAPGTNLRGVVVNGNGGLYAATGQALTVNGVISGPGVLNINPAGGAYNVGSAAVADAGTVVLAGANSFTGGVVLNSGVLQINGQFTLGGSVYGGATFNGGTLRFANVTGTNGSADISVDSTGVSRPVTLAAGGGTIDTNGSNVTFTGTIGNGGTGALTKVGAGTLTLAANDTYTGGTNLSAGSIVASANTALGTGPVSVGAGATLTVAATAGRTVLLANALTLAGSAGAYSGKVDVGSNDLDLPGASLPAVTAMAAQGFAGGTWNGGGGIVSSTAAADAAHLTGVGVIQNNGSTGSPLYGDGTTRPLFDRAAVGASDVLVKQTFYGDANLDGVVNAADYTQVDAGFALGLTGWQNGDFNYDGVVDGSDYTLMDNAFNQQTTALAAAVVAAPALAVDASAAAVPEPGGLVLAGGVLGLLASRRRRARA